MDPVAMLDGMAGGPPPAVETKANDNVRQGVYPSMGLRYGGKHPGGLFYMHPTGAPEEALLQSAAGDRMKIIDDLLRMCWVRPEITYPELLLSDKFYMLFFLRSISFGANYGFEVKCGSCQLKFQHKVPIPDGIVRRQMDPSDPEPFEAHLPREGKTLGLRLLRVKDEDNIRKLAAAEYSKSTQVGDPAYMLRLAHHIVTVDGAPVTLGQALQLVKKLLSPDTGAMRKAIDALDIGISLKLEVDCPRCGESQRSGVPFTPDFFRTDD